MTGPADERLRTAPMLPVRCEQCGAGVLARKSSWAQTSVQWNAAATAACVERHAAAELSRAPLPYCTSMRESIRAAAESGVLPVLDPDAGGPR
ncbi:hypothetical protein NRB20_49560 [Nocardia sp. RB20]|uniref:Ferredoxin n=2 Tax=Nocardia macrotermitis TaxID=2585198 RepID=A0A7K0D7T9_9NOCA|nr:hypothetical protein [Nocardia macrotermitis]